MYVFGSWMQSYVFHFERKYAYAGTYSSAASVITGQCAFFRRGTEENSSVLAAAVLELKEW